MEDDPSRHIELRWQGTIRAEAGRAGSWIEGFLEERFNVTFRPTFIVYFSLPRVLPIRLMAGDVPDVTWTYARDLTRFARHGFALELPVEVIRKYAPNYVRLLNEHAPENWMLSYFEGENFGLPLFTIEKHRPRPGVWRMDWLRNVGIDRPPETLEEMREALWRFRHQDPNGSGRRDTYGMCPWRPPSIQTPVDTSFSEIFAAYGVMTTGWMIREGRVVWGGTLPETREVLGILRNWYADGLIAPDYMTMQVGSTALFNRLYSGQVGYIPARADYRSFDPSFGPSMTAIFANVNPEAELVPAPFPRGPAGHSGNISGALDAPSVLMFGAHLANEPEKLIRVLRMVDALASDEELYLKVRLGKRGLHWDWDPDRGLKALPPYDTRYHSARQLLHLSPEPWHDWGYYALFGASAELSNRFKVTAHRDFDAKWRKPEFLIPDALVHSTAVPSADYYLNDLVQMQVKCFVEIITGRRPLEYFDTFVHDWYEKGGRLLTAEANELYGQAPGFLERAGVPDATIKRIMP